MKTTLAIKSHMGDYDASSPTKAGSADPVMSIAFLGAPRSQTQGEKARQGPVGLRGAGGDGQGLQGSSHTCKHIITPPDVTADD